MATLQELISKMKKEDTASAVDNSNSILEKINKFAAEIEAEIEAGTEAKAVTGTKINSRNLITNNPNALQQDNNYDHNDLLARTIGRDILLDRIDEIQKTAAVGEKIKGFWQKIKEPTKKALPYVGSALGGGILGATATGLYYQKAIPEMQAQAYEQGMYSPNVKRAIYRAYMLGRMHAEGQGGE